MKSAVRRTTATIALAVSLLVLAGCTEFEEQSQSAAAKTKSPAATSEVHKTLTRIEKFWALNAKDAGVRKFKPVRRKRARELKQARKVICDGDPVPKSDARDNAVALECPEGDAIVWDRRFLQDLAKQFGAVGPTVLLAHEYGHVIDAQADVDLDGVDAEQYADCMAGAYVGYAYDEEIPPFDTPGSLDQTVATASNISDTPGDSAEDPDAHGLAFDRITAFQEGFNGGVKTCVTYEEDPPALIQQPFDKDEKASGGNAPYEEATELAAASLSEFLDEESKSIKTVDPELSSMSDKKLRALQDKIGDGATFTVIALDTFAASQEAAGEETDTTDAQLERACLLGAWSGWLANGDSEELDISPGDLDESVATFSKLTEANKSDLLFDQTDAMRAGFVEGVKACDLK